MSQVTKEQETTLMDNLQKIQRCIPLLSSNQIDKANDMLNQFIQETNLNRDDIV